MILSRFQQAARDTALESGNRGKVHGEVAFDHRICRARHRTAVDRSGHRRDRLAALEFHDQPAAMGGIWRDAWRGRTDPDLAGKPLTATADPAAPRIMTTNG